MQKTQGSFDYALSGFAQDDEKSPAVILSGTHGPSVILSGAQSAKSKDPLSTRIGHRGGDDLTHRNAESQRTPRSVTAGSAQFVIETEQTGQTGQTGPQCLQTGQIRSSGSRFGRPDDPVCPV